MKISSTTFTIEVNGFIGDPARALRDYLISKNAKRVTVISHPLVAEGSNKHSVTVYEKGKTKSTKEYKLPNKPPYTFALDPFVPLRVPSGMVWFCFNNLATLKGLRQKKQDKAQRVYYWAVDFVPERFGNKALTKIYNKADAKAATEADGRIELSEAALKGRAKYLKLDPAKIAPGMVVPMGGWYSRTPKTSDKALAENRLVYLGHLVDRQGVKTFIEALAILYKNKVNFTADVIGSGPQQAELEALAKKLKLTSRVTFHGFVEDFKEVETMLSRATVAVAPYAKDPTSFTQFADPGKLKAYLGAGLPIVLTDVPPNAHELESEGVAKVVEDSPEAFAEALTQLCDKKIWQKHHEASLRYAHRFDWEVLLNEALGKLGFK